MSKTILAVASLIGTIIGAGVFAIPYVFSQSGILTLFFYFLILGAVALALHLFLGEIVLRTEGKHRLVGYVEKYLGKKAKTIVGIFTILGAIGALLVYIILLGDFSKIIFPSFLSPLQWTLIWWAILSYFIFLGIKPIAFLEFLLGLGMLAVIFIIFGFCLPKIQLSNFVLFKPSQIFLPFGVLLFSLIGWNAVPEVKDLLFQKINLKKAITTAVLVSAVFYFFFGLIISGVVGAAATEETLSGLIPFLGHKVMVLGGIFGLLSVATSFLILGNYLKNTLFFDYRLPLYPAFFLACLGPLILFLIGFRRFISVVSIVGAFVGLVEGTAIALLFLEVKRKGDRKPEYSLKIPTWGIFLIIIVLLTGAITQVVYYFG